MKYIFTSAGLCAMLIGVVVFVTSNIEGDSRVYLNEYKSQKDTPYEKLDHDWECKYIIEDQYHGFIKYHYLNDYEELVDRSVQFIGNDGTVYRIPYPYYSIRENKQTV